MSAFPSSWGSAQPPPSYPPPFYASQTGTIHADDALHLQHTNRDFQGNATQIHPAYNPVQVRRSLEPSRPLQITSNLPNTAQQVSPSQATSSPAPSKDKFPPACREWVARAYLPQYAEPGVTRDDLEAKLKEIIRDATAQGRLWSDDWDNMDLPQVIIQKERAWTQQIPTLGPPFNGNASVSGITSKKRKSMDTDEDNESATKSPAPWVNANNRNLEDRLSYPQARQLRFQDDSSPKATSKFQKNMEKRHRKFDGGYKSTYKTPSPEPMAGPVVGRCQTLEKKYFRLTSAPDPDKVRPLHILEKALEVLKQKWRKEGNYSYICDQFKSMRQDLTVQRIKNEFTVSVYEIHARIALEKGDLGEYNQCQTQLRALYAQNIAGKDVEFKAYRILYFIHTCNRTALNDVLADLTTAEKREPAIKHALDVRSALALGNYHRFFRLYLDTPNMGAYLMDMFVTRERLLALSNICRAYKPHVKLRFITEELGFEGDNEAYHFILEHSPDLLEERSVGDEDAIFFLTGKAGTIFETAKTEAFRKVDLKGQI